MSFNRFKRANHTSSLLENRLSAHLEKITVNLPGRRSNNNTNSLGSSSLVRAINIATDGSLQPVKRTNSRLSFMHRTGKVKPIQTIEELKEQVIKIVQDFYENLNTPLLSKKLIDRSTRNNTPDADVYNEIWDNVINDLTSIFTELETIETITVDNFNHTSVAANRLTSRMRSVASKLGDYILFTKNPNKDSLYFTDSFNDISHLDWQTSLLNSKQCFVSESEGIVTLPLDLTNSTQLQVKAVPIIGSNSNGNLGNNQQIGAAYNGNISAILDNNADTTFEYERIIDIDDDNAEALILDLTINLGAEEIVNHIVINPNNFGTKTVINIEDISTSLDGEIYTSIKDDIPIADFTGEDEENVFTLSPATSKYAGQGLYTFTPRKCKYIHVLLRQEEPYVIDTPIGQRLRYAIGLRDIEIHRQAYENKGELISTEFTSQDEIKKALLQTSQYPGGVSELAKIDYFVSPDNGTTWHPISPKDFPVTAGIENPDEILNFNTVDRNSINSSTPVKGLRFKAVMSRDDEKFNDTTTSLRKKTTITSEVHEVPQSAPFDIDLLWPPVENSVSVIDPLFGSRGLPGSPYIVNSISDQVSKTKFRLPFTSLPRPKKKVLDVNNVYYLEDVSASEWLHVEIGGEEWTQVTSLLVNQQLDFNNLVDGKVFTFDPKTGVLEFGDGITNALKPSANEAVTIYFDAERLYPSETEDDHIATLEFNTSRNKSDFYLKRVDPDQFGSLVLPRKATVIDLQHNNIITYSGIADVVNNIPYMTQEVDFINGRDEFTTSGLWSLDQENGILYLSTPTPGTTDYTVSYQYRPITYIARENWDWATTNIFGDSITIKENAWKTVSFEEEVTLLQDEYIVSLSSLSTTKGTFEFVLTIDGEEAPRDDSTLGTLNPFIKEVDFINGYTELGFTSKGSSDRYEQVADTIPYALQTDVNGIASWKLSKPISTLGSNVPFTHKAVITLFVNLPGVPEGGIEKDYSTPVSNVLTNEGDFCIVRDPNDSLYGTVFIKTGFTASTSFRPKQYNTDTRTIYYTVKPTTIPTAGLYSIDYRNGIIYTQRAINPSSNSGNPGNWSLQVNYERSHYEAEYRIARFLDPASYEVDISNQRVRINDSEILKHSETAHGRLDNKLPYYIVNYEYVTETREGAADLAAYFTPILKDYSLRVLPKGKIF